MALRSRLERIHFCLLGLQMDPALMVEQADPCKCHYHSVLIAGIDHLVIADRAAWLGYILHAAFVGPVNVIAKGEEGIRSQ